MKRYSFFLLVMLLSISAFCQTVDEIVDKYINAIGGKEAWQKINSMSSTGSMEVQGNEVSIVSTTLNKKGRRQDITVMGMTGYTIITPKEGWVYLPFANQAEPKSMTPEELQQGLPELDVQGNLIDYKSKGHTVELLGKEIVDSVEYYKLKATLQGGRVETIYIDPKTFYISRLVANAKINGEDVDQTVIFSNYKKLPEGIVVPMTLSLPNGDLVIIKVEVNKPVDESIFKPN
jgi:hypothetical protein